MRRGDVRFSELAVALEAEEARPVWKLEKCLDPDCERGARDGSPHEFAILGAETERDLVALDGNVPPPQSGDTVGPRAARVLLRPHPEPRLVDEPDRDGAGPVALIWAKPEMPRRPPSQARQQSREPEKALELGALLRCAIAVVVDVLLAAGGVDAGRLEARARAR